MLIYLIRVPKTVMLLYFVKRKKLKKSFLVDVDFSLVPDVIRCGKLEIRDVIFESVPRNPLKFEKEELNTTETALPISTNKIDYLQFNGSDVS